MSALGRRRPSELGASWASEDYEQQLPDSDASAEPSGGESEDLEHEDSEQDDHHTPLRAVSHIQSSAIRRSPRIATPPFDGPSGFSPVTAGSNPASRKSASSRRSPRVGSRENSMEPSFIMPSMHHSSLDGSAFQESPLAAVGAQRRRKRASFGKSEYDSPMRLSQQFRRTPSREQAGLRQRRMDHAPEDAPVSTISEEDQPWVLPRLVWAHFLYPVMSFALSVCKMTLQTSKPFIAWILTLWLLFMIVIGLRNSATSAISNALSPLCNIPGMSYLSPKLCAPLPNRSGPIEFEQLLSAQSNFEDVLSSSTDIASLPYDMKRSEASIRDLRTVIRYSSLPSRNELAFEFTGFIEAARQASADLSNFDSRVGRAVDSILSTNRWTLSVLTSLIDDEASRGLLVRYFYNFIPLSSSRDPQSSREVVVDQYLRHTREVEDQVAAVILEAQGLLLLLQSLDERLDTIASIAARDGMTVRGSRDELLLSLWTRLGGNRSSMSKIDQHLSLLRSVGSYQRTAWQHVSATILKLQAIASQLEDLRERVAAPGVVGRDEVPLEVHIENIRLGVDRLEGVRGESRRVQGETYRRLVHGDQQPPGAAASLIERGTATVNAVPKASV